MQFFKLVLQFAFGFSLCMIGISQSFADYYPNDNYSSLVLSYQSSAFANPVCINNECHKGVSGPAGVFSYQIVPNIALGLSGSYLQSSGNVSEIVATTGSVFVRGIAGVGRSVDIGASLAALRTNLELCSSNPASCSSSADKGTNIGVFGKYFLNDIRSMSVGLSYNYIAFQESPNQSIVTLSLVTILAKHHRLAFSVDKILNSNGTSVSGGYGFGYSYLVF